jgi:DNA replicative helicase MCM subunit Mcm2 (Cdc46/Mcm family)
VHEYVESNLPELFEEVLENTPELIKIIETTIQYVEDRYGKSI